ncbi:MAG: 50S ribosomal protein L16 [Candidatus Ratteibacteria bacterium]
MPLMPKRIKYRKTQRGRTKGKAYRGSSLFFGDCGLQACEPTLVTTNQIEAGRVAISHYLKSKGKIWIRMFPDKPITKKPAESRLGKGKGDVATWACVVLPGRIMFEVGGVPKEVALEALRLASHKFSIKTKIICRDVL